MNEVECGRAGVVIMIVNWNCLDDVLICVRRLSGFNVLVIDNHSLNQSEVRRLIPAEVPVLMNSTNLGYGGGMNVGLKWARENGYAYALMLNPDTLVSERLVDCLVEEAERGSAAIVGVEQHYVSPDGRDLGAYPSAATLAGPRLTLVQAERGVTAEVDVVTGAAILVSLSWAEAVGYIDERFFHYKEEFDFVYRVRKSGGIVLFTTKEILLHRTGGSLPTSSPRAEYYRARNELLFLRRHFRRVALLQVPGFWLDSIKRACRSREHRQAVVAGVRDGFAGVEGRVDDAAWH